MIHDNDDLTEIMAFVEALRQRREATLRMAGMQEAAEHQPAPEVEQDKLPPCVGHINCLVREAAITASKLASAHNDYQELMSVNQQVCQELGRLREAVMHAQMQGTPAALARIVVANDGATL